MWQQQTQLNHFSSPPGDSQLPASLLQKALVKYKECLNDRERSLDFDQWRRQQHLKLPQFQYWNTVRQANFNFYSISLQQTAPDVAAAFYEGLFTVNKTPRKFSAIAIDHAHEQNNAIVKGDGGAVGLTEDPDALRRWMLSGPEIARMVNEFQNVMTTHSAGSITSLHHEAERSYQVAFYKDMKSLEEAIEEFGNPFLEETQDLIVLDAKVVADDSSVSRM
ncbi:hypothetical protein AC249_AIPGENE27542 [Exaiptasia diaphana]|nr:hypothetical protein AC249_AIPGENE27542 [Exaiptasia diaphana]